MHLNQIECFLELSETLNFSETADNLFLTQPAVSHQIKSLEDELGFQLFIRNKRNVFLTDAGVSFYNDMKNIYNRINISIAKAKNISNNSDSFLTISYNNSIIENEKLPLIISKLRSLYPECVINLNFSNHENIKNDLISGNTDISFTFKENSGNMTNFLYHELLSGNLVCVVPKSHDFSAFKSINLEDLKNQDIIFLDPLKSFSEMAKIQNKILTQNLKSNIYYCTGPNNMYTMIKSKVGIGIIPDFFCLNDKETVKIPIKISYSFSYGLLSLSKSSKKELRKFITLTRQHFKSK